MINIFVLLGLKGGVYLLPVLLAWCPLDSLHRSVGSISDERRDNRCVDATLPDGGGDGVVAPGVVSGYIGAVHEPVDQLCLLALGAGVRVPLVVARAPGQLGAERHEQVVERPRDDDVVVDTHDSRDQDHAITNT